MFALIIGAMCSVAFGAEGACEGDNCHVVPYFKGHGGFVGQVAEGVEKVEFVLTCGSVTVTSGAEPKDNGIVAQLMSMSNGLDCPDGGSVEISGLMDGGWYYITGDRGSAAASLVRKDVLGNAMVKPTDPMSDMIKLESMKDGATTIVTDMGTGRMGILHHILPEPEADPADMCGPYFHSSSYSYRQNSHNCMLGDGSTKIVLTADTTDDQGRVRRVADSVYRRVSSATDNEIRVGFSLWAADGQAHITTGNDVTKGYDMKVPSGIPSPEPFMGDYTVWLIEGEGRNQAISDADIRVDPARRLTEMVPGPEIPGTPKGTDTKELPVTHVTSEGAGCMSEGEDDTACNAVMDNSGTRRLEAGYFMSDEVAQCRQMLYDHSKDVTRHDTIAFKAAQGDDPVLVLATETLDPDLPAGATLEQQADWLEAWHRAGNARIHIVQVVEGEGDAAVTYDIPEVVCETWTYTFDVEATDPMPGEEVEKPVIETAGIIIGPAATTHCRSGRADVARLFIGVSQGEVHKHSPEIIPAASRAARINGINFAAYTTLNVMCPSSVANQAHHANLSGGVNLVPHTE